MNVEIIEIRPSVLWVVRVTLMIGRRMGKVCDFGAYFSLREAKVVKEAIESGDIHLNLL